MKIKWLVLLLFGCISADLMAENGAADSTRTKFTRNEQWQLYGQAGIHYILADNTKYADFGDLLTPSFALSIGKRFTTLWGGRFQLVGGKNNGLYYPNEDSPTYSFNHYGALAMVALDLPNLFSKKKRSVYHQSDWDANLLFGGGLLYTSFVYGADKGTTVDKNNRAHASFYAGLEVTRSVSDYVDIGLELSTNWMRNKFNGQESVKNSNFDKDGLINLMVGVRYTFKGKRIKKIDNGPAVAPVVIYNYEQKPIQSPIVDEKVAIERNPVSTATTHYTVEDLVEMIESEETIQSGTYSLINILFDTNRAAINPLASIQLDKIVPLMKHPGFSLVLRGYAEDAEMRASDNKLPEERVNAIKNYLIGKGVDPMRLAYQKSEATLLDNRTQVEGDLQTTNKKKVALEVLFVDE